MSAGMDPMERTEIGMDPIRRTAFLEEELQAIEARGLRRRLRTFDGPQSPRTAVEGRETLLFASNAYLGLNTHPEVMAAAARAIGEYGTGSGGSRLVTGTTRLHRELERELAELKGTEDAVLFGTGYQANVGVITALVGAGDLILSDELNHASIVDACRLSRARTLIYRHAAPADLARLLAQHRSEHRRCLVVTDGVFSMDGDVAPLPAIGDAARAYDALLMVDDAHGTGVLGPNGGGTVAHFGMHGQVDIQVGTLSKALASEGGFAAGSFSFCEYLRNRARPFIFSTAPAPATVAAGLAALRVMRREPERAARLLANGDWLRAALSGLGYRVLPGFTPIIPVLVGEPEPALALARALEEEGLFVPAIRPPTVPAGSSRLRVTVMATHTEDDLTRAVAAFAKAGRQVGVIA